MVRSQRDLTHAWSTLRADPMVFMAWNDMGIFTVLVLVWFARELVARKHSLLWWPATLIFGCPPLLIYLARYGGPQHGATDSAEITPRALERGRVFVGSSTGLPDQTVVFHRVATP